MAIEEGVIEHPDPVSELDHALKVVEAARAFNGAVAEAYQAGLTVHVSTLSYSVITRRDPQTWISVEVSKPLLRL
jgi:hypothetical protein